MEAELRLAFEHYKRYVDKSIEEKKIRIVAF